MNISFFKKPLSLMMVLLASVVITACGDSDSTSTATAQNYSGPGSKWDVNLAVDGTFAITRAPSLGATVDLTVDGTYVRLQSGFVDLTVTAATGTDAPATGDKAVGLEVPGYAFLLMPIEAGSSQMIPMVVSGECPTTDVSANWVMVNTNDGADASNAGRDYFGTFEHTVATGASILPSRYSLAAPTTDLNGQALAAGTCADGIMTVNNDAVMYLTSNGGAIVHTGTFTANDESDDNVIFALGSKAISNISNLDGDFAGVLFDEGGSSASILPVSMSCASGACTANIVTNVTAGTLSGDSATLNMSGAVDTPETGFVAGTISSGGGTGSLVCMADIDVLDAGKKVVSCIGQSPGDNTKMFNVLFVSI